jgi:glycosyltransferase involved in cell wall biosynthesis
VSTKRSLSTVDRAARRVAKELLREYGTLTAFRRGMPDFAIIGAKRGGTTSLYNYLLEHPLVKPMFPARQNIKGTHYFDTEYWRGIGWYRSHFPLQLGPRWAGGPSERTVTGEGSPYYLFHPLAAARMAADVPATRLVVVLRDPVERAYSHYKERVRHDAEPLPFAEALEREPERLDGEEDRICSVPGYTSTEHEDHSYVAQGLYAPMLRRWFSWFDPDQFLVLASEDLYADPNRVANDVWRFLGLPRHDLQDRRRFNYHPAADLDVDLRRHLEGRFSESNGELAELLQREMPWGGASSRSAARRAPKGATASTAPPAAQSVAGEPAVVRPSAPVPVNFGEEWPEVTVVVPTRDRPELLRRAVGSILKQDYEGSIACLVVFDRSAPAQIDVEVGERRSLRVVRNDRTPGLAGARNTGYQLATSPLLASCDDDDEWRPAKLRRQVEAMRRSGAELASTGIAVRMAERSSERLPAGLVDFGRLLRERVAGVHPSTYLLRREAIEGGVGLVDEAIPGSFGEDYEWLLRFAWRRPVVSIGEPLVDVYWNERSYFSRDWATIAAALRYVLERHPELRRTRKGYAWITSQIAFADAADGDRRAAVREAVSALATNPFESRAYLSLAIASRALRPDFVLNMANRRGHGI